MHEQPDWQNGTASSPTAVRNGIKVTLLAPVTTSMAAMPGGRVGFAQAEAAEGSADVAVLASIECRDGEDVLTVVSPFEERTCTALEEAREIAMELAEVPHRLLGRGALQAAGQCPDGCTTVSQSLGECVLDLLMRTGLRPITRPSVRQDLEGIGLTPDEAFWSSLAVDIDGTLLSVADDAAQVRAAILSPKFRVQAGKGLR